MVWGIWEVGNCEKEHPPTRTLLEVDLSRFRDFFRIPSIALSEALRNKKQPV